MAAKKTIYDIATEAGVSVATVSRVLNGSGSKVRPETATRVLKVVEKHKFKPNALARGLYHNRTMTLGIILPELSNPFYAELYLAAEQKARENGYVLLLFHSPYGESINEEMVSQLSERRLDGVITNGEFLDPHARSKDNRMLEELSHYMPVMLVGCMIPRPNCMNICIDLAECSRKQVHYLASLGHRRIMLLGGENDATNPTSREVGFFEALEKAGLDREDAFLPEECSTQGGQAAMEAVLSLPPEKRPTAVLCANDLLAFGAVRTALEKGVRIPQELSIISCDDTYLSKYMTPALTTMNIEAAQIGRMAVEALIHRIEQGESAGDAVIQGTMVLRESCARQG